MDDFQTAEVEQQESAVEGAADQASAPYVQRWNRLVSTTNWEKGRIITEWRDTLAAADAPAADYSDEAWTRLVAGVSGQHVGRLRRAHQRFGDVHQQYEGLYWSHFQAALDWDDAEMWLEGAVQNSWSVSQMRRRRRDTLRDAGATDEEPEASMEPVAARTINSRLQEVRAPSSAAGGGGRGESAKRPPAEGNSGVDSDAAGAVFADSPEDDKDVSVRPFEKLPVLADDLNDALEAFKLAILRHKAEGWRRTARDHVLASLDALKLLALAPAE